jgi:hypothetical protein
MRKPRTLLRVLRARRWRDLSDVAVAQVSLWRSQLLVWTRPRGRLVAAAAPHDGATQPTPVQQREAERLAIAVVRAARFGVGRPLCLVRALALQHMLERRGIFGSVVRIGVQRVNDALLAHAWVELGGAVLADSVDNTAPFSTLADVHAVAPRRGVRR